MSSWRLGDLAERLGAELAGNPDLRIRNIRPLDEAGSEDLSFLHNRKYIAKAKLSEAGAVIVADAGLLPGRNLLIAPEPYLLLARALELIYPRPSETEGVHPSAVVAEDVGLGAGVSVGPQAVIGPGSIIGARTHIGAGCVLGRMVEVGEDCLLHPRIVIEDGCRIGNRCILQGGVVIGGDGFGYASVDGVHHKVPQVGIVVLEDDVELGANVCVDRATLGETRIGRGVKVDNLVQIAHNVSVGPGSILVSQVGIAGSTQLGAYVVMGGQAGAAGHLKIGNGAQISAKTGVFKDLDAGALVSGIPARPRREWVRAQAGLARLEKMRKRIDEIERQLEHMKEEA